MKFFGVVLFCIQRFVLLIIHYCEACIFEYLLVAIIRPHDELLSDIKMETLDVFIIF